MFLYVFSSFSPSDGFRKVAKPDHGGLTSIREDSVEFWHTNFRKGHPELLPLVQRRVSHHSDNKKVSIGYIQLVVRVHVK